VPTIQTAILGGVSVDNLAYARIMPCITCG
jgi:hypothetical protein